MKKIISAYVLAAMLLTACGRSDTQTPQNNFNYKTGLATYTHTNDTYGYTEGKNGQSAVSTTIVAAVFDDKGKIIDINIDEVESKVNFDNTGRLTNYNDKEVISKKELRDDYGMKAASSIGKEWYQQVETLEEWLVGKDVNTVISSAAGKIRGMGDMSEYNTYKNHMTDGEYGMNNDTENGMNNRTGSANSDSATSGSAVSDAESIAEDFADGVGDVVDDIMGGGTNGGTTDSGTMFGYNTDWMDADLKAGVTIDITYIQRAIEKAYKNAK